MSPTPWSLPPSPWRNLNQPDHYDKHACACPCQYGVVDLATAPLIFTCTLQVGNRKLLWHGTNVAVVAAILKSGLRIMPHSGGRVGKGIYLGTVCATSVCAIFVRSSCLP